ncbi:MAG: hypothetical protein HC921_22140 [Synechococcaceae cyanobacterium SM2_3_1]|nr:hypothetical protein [Synechococcaceae cyanobacterium SM2_3_1]
MRNYGYTCFLFEILKMWGERHLQRQDILFLKRMIPQSIFPTQQDPLLNEYYRFFISSYSNLTYPVQLSFQGGIG